MNTAEITANLPPLHQQIVLTLLGCVAFFWILRQIRLHRFYAGYALLWFTGIAAGIFIIWCDPVLIAITAGMGVGMPASSLLLLALFYLFMVCAWLTAMVSMQQERIANLIIEVSILKSKIAAPSRITSTPPHE